MSMIKNISYVALTGTILYTKRQEDGLTEIAIVQGDKVTHAKTYKQINFKMKGTHGSFIGHIEGDTIMIDNAQLFSQEWGGTRLDNHGKEDTSGYVDRWIWRT